MPILGTKKFWRPAPGASPTQKENQILKNSGYINIQLFSVNYMSKGNFWQNTFGGTSDIALTTTLKYTSGVELIEATAVQDFRTVKVNKNYNLGLQRNIAVKIPAIVDDLYMDVKMTAVKNDKLEAKFDMLNKPDYQSALQLAPVFIGQALTITSLVKDLFSESGPSNQLEASFAAIISKASEDNPIKNGKLTKGMLIMVSTNEGDSFNNVDESKFALRGEELYYKGTRVENTYVIFNISFDQYKGADEKAEWFAKYNEALNNLEKIRLNRDKKEIERIFTESKTLWIEGNALINADQSYINSERIKIKAAIIKQIDDKYIELTDPIDRSVFASTAQRLLDIAGPFDFKFIKEALPQTVNFLNQELNLNINMPISDSTMTFISPHEDKISALILKDAENYIGELNKQKIGFNWKNK